MSRLYVLRRLQKTLNTILSNKKAKGNQYYYNRQKMPPLQMRSTKRWVTFLTQWSAQAPTELAVQLLVGYEEVA